MHGFQFQNSVWIAYSPRGAETLCCLLSIETELILGYNYNRVGSTFLQLDCYSPFCCSFIVIIIFFLSFLWQPCSFLFSLPFPFYSPSSTFTSNQPPPTNHQPPASISLFPPILPTIHLSPFIFYFPPFYYPRHLTIDFSPLSLYCLFPLEC